MSETVSPWRGIRPWTRHSQVLAVSGLVYVGCGLAFLTTELTPRSQSTLRVALHWLPISGWGCVFLLVGLLAILSSRWPPASETWGYAAMTGLAGGWASTYVAGVALGAPVTGLLGALVWGLLAYMWWAVSGLVNPSAKARR